MSLSSSWLTCSVWQIEMLDLTELDVAGIAPGDEVAVTFDALPSLTLTGRRARIRPVGETSGVAPISSLLPQRTCGASSAGG